jgi:DNA polymerase I-like protein with 3'-5' exonuclease and polymerase domains
MEIDYNAAELRTLLALSEKEQPKEDIHEWNIKNVYRDLATRQEAKERIFAWLYNPASKDYLSNRAYERDKVLEKYWDGKEVKTIFNKVIPSDRHHALNYIIQSTTAEMFLKQMVKVHEILKEKKSFIAFSVHDSLVIDLAKEDKELIPELIKVFEETPIGNFKANLSLGKSYGKMRKV